MEATDKQIIALKRFAKKPELSRDILKGVSFGDLSKKEASDLIGRCYDYEHGVAEDINDVKEDSDENVEFGARFSQNYKKDDGSFGTVTLTGEELADVRGAHREHCEQVMEECLEVFSDDRELQLAMFDKRADKVFTWIQQALDEKVRKVRGGSNGS